MTLFILFTLFEKTKTYSIFIVPNVLDVLSDLRSPIQVKAGVTIQILLNETCNSIKRSFILL